MKLHRFFTDFDVTKKTAAITDPDLVSQIKNVLRLKSGEQIVLVSGGGMEVLATITDISTKAIETELHSVSKNEHEPERKVALYCAVIKKENFEWVAQKVTEIGVTEIIPLISSRTVKLQIKRDRIEKIIKEAAEQSGRGIIPQLSETQSFEQAVATSTCDANILFDGSGDNKTPEYLSAKKSIGLFIGPEGGWDPKEIALAREKGFVVSSLGKLTLRAETAAVIASYLAVHCDTIS